MSSALHIATVTTALRNLIHAAVTQVSFEAVSGVTGAIVTTKPLDAARNSSALDNQVNVFLYQTQVSPGLTNRVLPGLGAAGERGHPALPLDLHYLITAYGKGDDDREGHRLLGQVAQVLHDHPILNDTELQAAVDGSTLGEQVERVRITHQPLALEDLSRLWTSFQTNYRVSLAYVVSLVLIESERDVAAHLPVLSRVVQVHPRLGPFVTSLASVEPPLKQPAARLGETIALRGHYLIGAGATVEFDSGQLAAPIVLTPVASSVSNERIDIALPNGAADHLNWVAGVYRVRVQVTQGDGSVRETETRTLMLAPKLTSITPNPAAPAADGSVTLTLKVQPHLRIDQRLTLLFGARALTVATPTATTDTLVISVPDVVAGQVAIRLRVDGVDSLVVDYGADPLAFDPSQAVQIS